MIALLENFLSSMLIITGLIVLFLLVKPLLKKIGATWRYYAWLVVVIGLLIPFKPQFNSAQMIELDFVKAKPQAVSQFDSASQLFPPASATAVEYSTGQNNVDATSNGDLTISSYDVETVTPKLNNNEQAVDTLVKSNIEKADFFGSLKNKFSLMPTSTLFAYVFITIWAIVATGLAVYQLLMYFKFKKTYRRWQEPITSKTILSAFINEKKCLSIKQNINIVECCCISTPMLMGIFKPTVILPHQCYKKAELALILRHELIHFKRKDLLYKFLLLIVSILYWFNPLVKVMANRIQAECEASCDERTLSGRNMESRVLYGEIIIDMLKSKSLMKTPLSTAFYEKKRDVKLRLETIVAKTPAKNGVAIVLVFAIITILSGSVFAFDFGGAGSANSIASVNPTKLQTLPSTASGLEKITVSQYLDKSYNAASLTIDEKKWLNNITWTLDVDNRICFVQTVIASKAKSYVVEYEVKLKPMRFDTMSILSFDEKITRCAYSMQYRMQIDTASDLYNNLSRKKVIVNLQSLMDVYEGNWRHLDIYDSITVKDVAKI